MAFKKMSLVRSCEKGRIMAAINELIQISQYTTKLGVLVCCFIYFSSDIWVPYLQHTYNNYDKLLSSLVLLWDLSNHSDTHTETVQNVKTRTPMSIIFSTLEYKCIGGERESNSKSLIALGAVLLSVKQQLHHYKTLAIIYKRRISNPLELDVHKVNIIWHIHL